MKSSVTSTKSITASGTAAANLCELPVSTAQQANVQLSGTWAGTITFEATLDGTTWHSVAASKSDANKFTTVVSTATGNGVWRADVIGYKSFRARCSAFTSGTIVVDVYSAFADRAR